MLGVVMIELALILCLHDDCNLLYPCQAIKALIDTSEGDMRKAITCLQSAARLKGQEEVTKEDVYEIAGVSLSSLK